MPGLELVMDKSNTEYDVINSKGLIHSHQPPLTTGRTSALSNQRQYFVL